MLLLDHRVNQKAHLEVVPPEFGVEVDVRDYDGELRLVHDPLRTGESWEAFLDGFRHALLAVNVKCDGLEAMIAKSLAARGIENYFFVDVASPTLVKLARQGFRKVAVRWSELETLGGIEAFRGKFDWAWADPFDGTPLDEAVARSLKKDFKVCYVSPELHGHPRARIAEVKRLMAGYGLDAVCSDFCADWR